MTGLLHGFRKTIEIVSCPNNTARPVNFIDRRWSAMVYSGTRCAGVRMALQLYINPI